MSGTPRTNHRIDKDADESIYVRYARMVQHAYQLERELNIHKTRYIALYESTSELVSRFNAIQEMK